MNFNTLKDIKPNCDIVIGLVYGDEGKGKITNYLAQKVSEGKEIQNHLCIRYNGGPNAGHTVYKDGVKVVTHQIPTGVIWGMTGIIGDNCYVDIYKLQKELQEVEELTGDVTIRKRLYISKKAHLILQTHIQEDSKDKTIGTTRSGIGPCARDKYERTGRQLGTNLQLLENAIPNENVISPYELIQNAIKSHRYILVEGAQGFGLDITHGDYPYLTSSHCCATDCLNMGIPFRYVRDIYGVGKAYDTYVGAKEFQTEGDDVLHKLQVVGEEFGATTGRQRQCNYLNLDFLIRSINTNSCTKVILNKCDILKRVDGSWKFIYLGELHNYNSYGLWEKEVYNIILRDTWINRNSIKFSFSKSDI